MRSLLTALAMASLVASPALAAPRHVPQHLYMYQNEAAPTPTQSDPPSLTNRGYVFTDPDPSIRSEMIRGYASGSTD